jgi:hypothetical protein
VTDPLATPDQNWNETLALRLAERPDIRAAREAARALLLADPLAKTFNGRLGLDRALDQWVMALCMREANGDPARPKIIWNVDNAPRHWFGHVYPGAAVAVDNPDNMNRDVPIDGDGRYELDIQFAENPASLSIVVEVEPEHHAGIGEFVAALTTLDLDPQPGKHITVSVDAGEPGDRKYHVRTKPGRLQLYTRDSHADWAQRPAAITVRRLDAPATSERSENEIAAAIVAAMTPFVAFWSGFKNTFLGPPEPNILVGPQGRIGGWGFLAGGRFKLGHGEALLVTINHAGAAYTGFQISDAWTIAPDPVWRTTSRNKTQSVPNADGTVSFIMAAVDPGIVNWIDTAGLAEGWMLLRWQGVPPDADTANFIREVKVIGLDAIPAELPRIDLAGRRAEIVKRAALHHKRTEAGR